MKRHADKIHGTTIQAASNALSQKTNFKKNIAQLVDNRPESLVRKKEADAVINVNKAGSLVQKKENNTGLPDKLKSGIENLSGHSMDDVKVHYHSSKPAQLNAHAYAQGSDIHIAPGQEKHLAHEAWHVIQQKQGRVSPTKQLKEKVKINDDASLEKEADAMGNKALQMHSAKEKTNRNTRGLITTSGSGYFQPVQRIKVINYGSGTSPKTLMPSKEKEVDAVNIDSGHMLLARVIEQFLRERKGKDLGNIIHGLLEAYRKSTRNEHASIENMEATVNESISWMKQEYFVNVKGHEGVRNEVKKMSPEAQAFFEKEAAQLKDFKLGDAKDLPKDQSVDRIYCINGYGYSPLTEENIFMFMHQALKPDGKLIIISEIMGPTVEPFLNFTRKDRRILTELFIKKTEEKPIPAAADPKAGTTTAANKEAVQIEAQSKPMKDAFSLLGKHPVAVAATKIFKYSEGSAIFIKKTSLLESDDLTRGMESHHTEGGGQLDDTYHVRLEFIK